mmetsp:Transcript_15658/g.43905  ORF Transcript_15658/g.43905 Transcript_15658/m.43905 type:complete len:432 (-) Transcript_15658:141-1436(-)
MSSYVDPTSGSVVHCEAMANEFPDLAETYYEKIAQYCQQKLWHQLTLLLLEFLNNKDATLKTTGSSNTFIQLYEDVVQAVSSKLQPLALARIASAVAIGTLDKSVQAAGAGIAEVEASKAMLQSLLESIEADQTKANQAASFPAQLFLQSKISLLTLTQGQPLDPSPAFPPSKGDLATIYSKMKESASLLDQWSSDTPEAAIVHATHYETSMTYYKIVGPPEAFYEQGVSFLNYASENSAPYQHQLAVDLCLAALTGEGVYNLGQVVTNPVLLSLRGTPDEWLLTLLESCSKGSVSEFRKLVQTTYASQIAAQPALTNRAQAIQEKMTLLALVQMVFERPASERTLKFTDIAQRLDVPAEQVEWILMRAFSVKLMEGSMDQVDETVHVTWVMPRVLSPDQMKELSGRFGQWAVKVDNAKDYMREECPALTT